MKGVYKCGPDEGGVVAAPSKIDGDARVREIESKKIPMEEWPTPSDHGASRGEKEEKKRGPVEGREIYWDRKGLRFGVGR